MNPIKNPLSAACVFVLFGCVTAAALPKAGFFLPDSVHEITLRYREVNNLIILPVTINDSVRVNLILDTGCRNLILFGKKFQKLLRVNSDKVVQFSGLGSRQSIKGLLSLGNKVSIDEVLGERIPVVVVGNKNLFGTYHNIHGVIGYDIFLKFEIEINPRARTIAFRSALAAKVPDGYSQIPMKVVDAKPMMQSRISIGKKLHRAFDLLIDTGSSLGLLLKTKNISEYDYIEKENILGVGFNGPISGYETLAEKLVLTGFEMEEVPAGIVWSTSQNNGSIGMGVLKDYIIILNYCKEYACLKRNTNS